VFKDFKNHVLHVRDNYWGGALTAAEAWRQRTDRALKDGEWRLAVHAAGVLSHYLADPVQPFHTGQTEEENTIHRAVEWSFSKSFPTLKRILDTDLGGFPDIEMPEGPDWMAQMQRAGAERANAHYETVVDHYDFKVGAKDPPAGLDDELRTVIAGLLGYATSLHARVLERIIEESGARPPQVNLTLDTLFTGLKVPIRKILAAIEDGEERKLVAAMYEEFTLTGKVRNTLPDDDREVRALYASEVLKVPLSELDCAWPRETGLAHTPAGKASKTPAPKTPRAPKTEAAAAPISRRLTPEDDIVEAPSIGPKTAARLKAIGIETIAQLLAAYPEPTARALDVSHITTATITEWQAQARMVCDAPGLTGTAAQILVGSGVTTAELLAAADPAELQDKVRAVCASNAGERLLRGGKAPEAAAIAAWIETARRREQQQAA
jgi:predicted flap endonuclease-1-like 5' DNA nuclease